MRHFGTADRMVRTAAFVLASLGFTAGARAQTVWAPPLHAISDVHVCNVTNLNSTPQFVTVEFVNDTGGVDCIATQTIDPGKTFRVECNAFIPFPGAIRSCEVIANTATAANKLQVSFAIEDSRGGGAGGNFMAVVNGTDSVTAIGSTINTPSFRVTADATVERVYECLAVNTGPAITVNLQLITDGNGALSSTGPTTVGQNQILGVNAAPTANGMGYRCSAVADTATKAKQLRVQLGDFTYTDAGGGPGTTSAVEGGL